MDKLDEIITKVDEDFYKANSYYQSLTKPESFAIQVALEFAKHILEEAAENAEVEEHYPNPYDPDSLIHIVNKQSITDTLNNYL